MLHLFDPLRDLEFTSLLARLLLALLCGAVIGLERSAKNRPAGFRTHMLVCLSGAIAAVTGHYIYLGQQIPADITRLSGQIITGLGFLGAGTILVTKRMSIKGLTTAAGLWVTGIIGLAFGSGFYEGGLLGTMLVLLVQTVMSNLRRKIRIETVFWFRVLYNEKDSLDEVMRYLKNQMVAIQNLQIRKDDTGKAVYSAVLKLRTAKEQETLLQQIREMPGIVSAAAENK